jgi:hypothetical protein
MKITTSRNSHGQGIILGVLVVMLLGAIICGGCVLLASIGTAMYYQQRFNHVAHAAARYAVNCNYWLGAQRPNVNIANTNTSTIAVATAMLGKMGVPAGQATVNVDQTNSDGCNVTIVIDGLQIIQGIVSGTISVTAQGSEPWLAQAPIGLDAVGFAQTPEGYFLPSYGAGAHTPGPQGPPHGFNRVPYWENGGFNGLTPPIAGPFQNTVLGGACADCY